MFNVECCKLHDRWSLNFFNRILLNGHPGGFVFFWGGLPEKGAQFFLGGCDLHRNYGMGVILLSFLCNYDSFSLKLHQGKCCYPDEGWLFIGGPIHSWKCTRMSFALKASKKSTKIHHEYDARPLIKSYNCY